MKKIIYLVPALSLAGCTSQQVEEKPNVIVILADDLGFGDVSAYGSTTIHTPNIDSLARGGVCFTNGYATSATSTPSRYALMTGMYPWKNKDAKILPGDAPLIINESQYTLPKMMRECGYVTGAIGKWQLAGGKNRALNSCNVEKRNIQNTVLQLCCRKIGKNRGENCRKMTLQF